MVTVAADVNVRISDLFKDIMRSIFMNGVQKAWKACDESDRSNKSNVVRYEVRIIPMPTEAFKNSPEVLQAINCVQVCRDWWQLIKDDGIWGQLDLRNLYYELDPTLYGKEVKYLLRNVEVLLVCRKESLGDIVNKIILAAKSSRTRFLLNFPDGNGSLSNNEPVWNTIRPHLREHATTLNLKPSP